MGGRRLGRQKRSFGDLLSLLLVLHEMKVSRAEPCAVL